MIPRRTPKAVVPAPWKAQSERSHVLVMRFMVWLSLCLGRRLSRVVLYGIAAYFFVFGGSAKRASKDYLRRVLRQMPGAAHGFRHVLAFATVIHDRIYLLKGKFSVFEIEIEQLGVHALAQDLAQGTPLLLLGGHLGSFELLRALGEKTGIQVSMMMYQENAAKLNATLAALRPDPAPRVISLQHVNAMLLAKKDMAEGRVLGMLADRRLGGEPADTLDFLGAPALFPRNPFRLANILRCKIYFMTGLYLGGNRYAIHLVPLNDFSQPSNVSRSVQIAAAQQAYVQALERFTTMAPYNWFNFFDFWDAPNKPR